MKKNLILGVIIAIVVIIEAWTISHSIDPIAYAPFIFLFLFLDGILLLSLDLFLKLLKKRKTSKKIRNEKI